MSIIFNVANSRQGRRETIEIITSYNEWGFNFSGWLPKFARGREVDKRS